MITYFSNAEWPEESGITNQCGQCESRDSHQTERDAESICKMLERDGLGGDGIFFPIRTWVSEECSFERSGWCESPYDCQYKEECDDGSFICEGCL